MNSYERFMKRMQGKTIDRPPNIDIIMQLAVHYIGSLLLCYYKDDRVLVETNMAMGEDFGLDIIQAISDPVVVMLQGTSEEVYQAVTNCLKRGGSRAISSAG